MLPSASLSVVRISNTQSRVLQFDTTGAGNQERSDLGLHPLKLLFEPPGGIVEAKDLPMPLKINGQKITVVWFTDTGFVVNDHGQKVGLRVSVLDSVPSSQNQLEAELFEAKRHPTQDEIRQIEIVGALRFYVWDIGELNKSLEEIQNLYMNDQIHRDVLLPLDSKEIPDEVKERKHRKLLEFRIAYRQHIVGVKQADRDFHSNLVDEGFPCDGQTYRDVIRKIENHHNLLRDQIDRRLKPFAKAANS